MALVFVWGGWKFTRFAFNRISELAEMPLWLIHIAWPVAGLTWLVFIGEQFLDDFRILLRKEPQT
jgi:TRAP-type C4-dicarboxylate transport system permease small subunit